jgi:acetyl-CoA C-acetyltransferase
MSSFVQHSKRLFSRRNVVIVGGKRTPIGTFLGGLSNFSGTQLGVFSTKGALSTYGVNANDVEEVYFGNVV